MFSISIWGGISVVSPQFLFYFFVLVFPFEEYCLRKKKKKTRNGDFIADRPKGTQNAPQLSGVQDYGRNLDES